jgi:hypothetical protein
VQRGLVGRREAGARCGEGTDVVHGGWCGDRPAMVLHLRGKQGNGGGPRMASDPDGGHDETTESRFAPRVVSGPMWGPPISLRQRRG